MSIGDLLRVEPGSRPDLDAIDPAGTPGWDGDKAAARDRLKELRAELGDFQERLWAESSQSLLIVLQALDAGGKDGLIRKVITAFNPQGTRVTGFGVPSDEELRHDYLWRVHANAPGRGRIGVFNRSHYEDVLVVRVNTLVPEAVWRDRYDQMNAWEAHLAANGTRIVKLYLHISRDEQRDRFQKRLDNPEKHWKWSSGDLETREKWADFRAAYADALARCSTEAAPWFVIPADRKWYRDLAAAESLAEVARQLDPQWPPADEDLGRRHPGVTSRRIHRHEVPIDRRTVPRVGGRPRRLCATRRRRQRGIGLFERAGLERGERGRGPGPDRGRRVLKTRCGQAACWMQDRAKSSSALTAWSPASLVTVRSIFGSSATSRQIDRVSSVPSSSCASV